MAGDDDRDFRGPIAPTLGNPMRTRIVWEGGTKREVQEPVLQKRAARNDGDALVEGLRDLEFDPFFQSGKTTGFADYAASMRQRQGGTGAGSDVTTDYRPHDDYGIGSIGGGGQSVSQTFDLDGDLDSDLFGQPSRPARDRPRAELYDPADGERGRRSERQSLDGEDVVFQNDVDPTLEDYAERDRPRTRSDSTFARRKW